MLLLQPSLLPSTTREIFLTAQTHNLNCTEGFYKENVIQHLKGKKVSKEEAEKMRKLIENAQESEATTGNLQFVQA